MIICGIKLTHDGAIALIDNGKLIFSYEMEKLNNQSRYSEFCISLEKIEEILSSNGYSLKTVDRLVIDGWDAWDPAAFNSTEPKKKYSLSIPLDNGDEIKIYELAAYGHFVSLTEDIMAPGFFKLPEHDLEYASYLHVTSHVAGAYCSSPFAKMEQDAYILVWDGGMPPQLFYYNYHTNRMENMGHLFLLAGYIYINFAHAFEPFNGLKKDLSIAGKVMAYIALGKADQEVLEEYRKIYSRLAAMVPESELNIDIVAILTAEFIKEAKNLCSLKGKVHADMLATFHVFLQELILETLGHKVQQYPQLQRNLCFAGGSALNIKWNSHIRDSGIFQQVWVPPFPNDSGSAIGTACCEMMRAAGLRHLEWNVYSGPAINETVTMNDAYAVRDCTLQELAVLLHESGEPVVFLNGCAELGPRALGNRSILAPAIKPSMKKLLNKFKGREDYRPVAPICIEEEAPVMFEPGNPDPFMLYEHWVRDAWKDKIPAICHLDGTARLQTVNKTENPVIYELLTHYKNVSGIPLLCNTSANFNGSGFFPDVESAMKWDRANFIWSEGRLYFKDHLVPKPVLETEIMQSK